MGTFCVQGGRGKGGDATSVMSFLFSRFRQFLGFDRGFSGPVDLLNIWAVANRKGEMLIFILKKDFGPIILPAL